MSVCVCFSDFTVYGAKILKILILKIMGEDLYACCIDK